MSSNIIYDVLFFFIVFLIIFVFNYLGYLKKIKNEKKKNLELFAYLTLKFNLDRRKLKPRQMILTLSLINAFIIAFVATFLSMLDINFMWQILIGFVMLMALIYSIYEIYGRYLVKKGLSKEKRSNNEL